LSNYKLKACSLRTRSGDISLQHISFLTNLEELEVYYHYDESSDESGSGSSDELDKECLSGLSTLTKLKYLSLSNLKVSEVNINYLTTLINLEKIDLSPFS
jgi:Leucine-rich repeat (LRR) protein